MPTPPPDPLFFEGPDAFDAWLCANGETADEAWIRMAKKSTGIVSLTWVTAVEVALCHGWIDGVMRRIDDSFHVQRFTPRRARSTWSKVNRVKVEALIAAGRMRPRGLAEVERAKADGRWDAAYDGMAAASVPEDLAAALDAAGLRATYDALSAQNRYAFVHRVQTAKTASGRAKCIATLVARLAEGRTPHP
jgi:uncharacterized protein YdeI (YjbR/CyaY-like superfamily)